MVLYGDAAETYGGEGPLSISYDWDSHSAAITTTKDTPVSFRFNAPCKGTITLALDVASTDANLKELVVILSDAQSKEDLWTGIDVSVIDEQPGNETTTMFLSEDHPGFLYVYEDKKTRTMVADGRQTEVLEGDNLRVYIISEANVRLTSLRVRATCLVEPKPIYSRFWWWNPVWWFKSHGCCKKPWFCPAWNPWCEIFYRSD